MELWTLLFLLVLVLALGTVSNFVRFTRRRNAGPFALRQSHLRHVNYEGFGGGFGVGFNGGFGVGANGGFGDTIEPNFGSIGVDDKKMKREGFYGGGHGGGGHGGGGRGGGFGGRGGGFGGRGGHGGWHGPNGYNGPNQGTWRGWGGDDSGSGWYGWSYPWAWYTPVKIAVECYSDADCGENGVCATNGYCMDRASAAVI